MERKCRKCNTWNTDNDFCTNCNAPLSPQEIRKAEVAELERKEADKPKDKVDLFLEKMKDSRYILVRGLYYICFSLWAAFMAVLAFFLWLVAATPG